jgi:CMP-N-acetylneuraminic acid synthetase
MKLAALIPARLDSKRLPQKNIRIFGGKPLLFWSIDFALATDVFQRICVSTESEKVQELVRTNYSPSEVEILERPADLATDRADLNDVCKHFLENAQEITFLSLLMPTYPFRNAQRILNEIIPPLYSGQIDRVTSVCPGSYSTYDYWVQEGQIFKRMFTNPPLWCGAGNAAYPIQKREYFFLPLHKWPYCLGERTLRIQTDYRESIDIDTAEDLKEAERICFGEVPYHKKLNAFEAASFEIIAPEGTNSASLLQFLHARGISADLPMLILRPASPLFTFLRLYECNSSKSYNTEETNKILANLPASGHSQDFPVHYIHSSCYRVLRREQDQNGILEETVPASQVLFEEDLKREWPGYVEPLEWIAPRQ